MKVNAELLQRAFDLFCRFIKIKDHQPFTTFNNSTYIDNQENYKYSVYEDARYNLGSNLWKTKDIGTGLIQEAVTSAIKTTVDHGYKTVTNNLIDWRKKDNFSKQSKDKLLEQNLYNFYKNKTTPSQAFDIFLSNKLNYQLIAYLFFIKNKDQYLPISQEKFDAIFDALGVLNFTTSRNASWENYLTYIQIVKEVKEFLKNKGTQPTLLDAHSFIWILGNQMQDEKNLWKENSVDIVPKIDNARESFITESEIIIPDDDDESCFIEGREIFRLHKLKERNALLIQNIKTKQLEADEMLCCEVCGFSFLEKYGDIGKGFIEAHHIFPISELTEETETKIEDIVLVCSNCHRMLHRRRPWINANQLRSIL